MGGYCAGICGHLRSCGRSESEKHGGFSNILAQGSPPRHYSGFSISSTQSKTFFEVMWSLFRCPRLFKKSTETHLIWSSLVTFTKIQFHRVREFEAKSKTAGEIRSSDPPLNATCISLRSESDRSDSRLRCLGCCPAKSNHQAPHAAFFFVLPHGSWSAELPPPE